MTDTDLFSDGEVNRSPYSTALAMKAAATQLHEIGHAFDLGTADDKVKLETAYRFFEIYSGSTGKIVDTTPEQINNEITWSIMAKLDADFAIKPMDGRYFAISIEEASTIKEV